MSDDLTEREQIILSTHNWVGSAYPPLSEGAKRIIFEVVLNDRLGITGWTKEEVARVLGEMAGYRKAMRQRDD